MDIICLCSKNEGTPVSLIEAQASSKPIISTKTGGIENIVMENKTALLSENGDESQFINNLIKLIESSQLRKQLSILSKKKSDEFSYKNLINNVKELYKQ
jgi:glycosyltransferase involved in cell wall biosynthesis